MYDTTEITTTVLESTTPPQLTTELGSSTGAGSTTETETTAAAGSTTATETSTGVRSTSASEMATASEFMTALETTTLPELTFAYKTTSEASVAPETTHELQSTSDPETSTQGNTNDTELCPAYQEPSPHSIVHYYNTTGLPSSDLYAVKVTCLPYYQMRITFNCTDNSMAPVVSCQGELWHPFVSLLCYMNIIL